MRYRATCEHFKKVEVITYVGIEFCADEIPCPAPSLPCACPTKGGCSSDYQAESGVCNTPGYEANYLSSFNMDTWTFVVPYVSTSSQSESSLTSCSWYGDPGTGLALSGLSYIGVREVDMNTVTLKYDLNSSGCEGCVSLVPSPTGAITKTVDVKYFHRCEYGTPPAYMYLQRAASGTYLNWTYEITGGVFITRNASAVLQNSIDLSINTMAAAVTTINGWPETIANGPGVVAAATWPADMWEDRAAALIPVGTLQPIYLFANGGLVEHYQHGVMGPRWTVQDRSAECTLGNVYALKVGCDDGPCDYEGGTDATAEIQFCKGVGADWCDYVANYDPTTGVGESNFGNWCGSVSNFPTGFFSCDSDTGNRTWEETPCSATTGWTLCLNGFGDRAMIAASYFIICSDDVGAWAPTYCVTSSAAETCDQCDCGGEIGRSCVKESERNGWAISKYFSLTRL